MGRRSRFGLFISLAIIGALGAAGRSAAADDIWGRFFGETPPPEALERELRAFEDSRQTMRETIRDTVERLSAVQDYDLEAAEGDAERIREDIEGVLGDLGPEGDLGAAANGAYRWMLAQRERVRARTDLTPAQKEYLLPEWDLQIAEVERVLDELRAVETRLTAQLRVVAGHEGFLEELLVLGKARVATETLQSTLAEFRRIAAEFEALGVDYSAPVN